MPEPGYWKQLYEKLLAMLEDGSWARMSSYTVAGRSVSYRSIDEFKRLLDWVKDQAAIEAGRPDYRGRMYAGQRGRG